VAVPLKIDDCYDNNRAEIAKQITRGGNFGIPYHMIFDADEKALIDSAGPSGNFQRCPRFGVASATAV
jgi:hypothetical protein